jgi:AcrR family transcriptional regulator
MTRAANPDLPKRILDEGEAIIRDEGFEELNMRKLARRVGVTATAIYHYFEGKEDLHLQLKLRAAERLNDRIRRIEEGREPHEVIEELGRIYIDFAEAEPRLYRFLFETPLKGLPLTPSDTPVLFHTYFVAREALERLASGGKMPMKPSTGAMMGWMMLHGFCSLLISGTLQPAEGLESAELKELFMQIYAGGPMHAASK